MSNFPYPSGLSHWHPQNLHSAVCLYSPDSSHHRHRMRPSVAIHVSYYEDRAFNFTRLFCNQNQFCIPVLTVSGRSWWLRMNGKYCDDLLSFRTEFNFIRWNFSSIRSLRTTDSTFIFESITQWVIVPFLISRNGIKTISPFLIHLKEKDQIWIPFFYEVGQFLFFVVSLDHAKGENRKLTFSMLMHLRFDRWKRRIRIEPVEIKT